MIFSNSLIIIIIIMIIISLTEKGEVDSRMMGFLRNGGNIGKFPNTRHSLRLDR